MFKNFMCWIIGLDQGDSKVTVAANSMTCVGVYFKCQQYVVKVWESAAPSTSVDWDSQKLMLNNSLNTNHFKHNYVIT